MPSHPSAAVLLFDRPTRLAQLMRRIRRIYEIGSVTWSVRVSGRRVEMREVGIDALDLEHLIETGTIIEEETVESMVFGGRRARRYAIGGVTVEGQPIKYTIDVANNIAVVIRINWLTLSGGSNHDGM